VLRAISLLATAALETALASRIVVRTALGDRFCASGFTGTEEGLPLLITTGPHAGFADSHPVFAAGALGLVEKGDRTPSGVPSMS